MVVKLPSSPNPVVLPNIRDVGNLINIGLDEVSAYANFAFIYKGPVY